MTGRLLALLLLALLGWLVEGIIQPVLPLVILERGGTAATVGLAAAIYSLPSLLARPSIGRAIDKHGYSGIQRSGGLALAIAPLGYIFPLVPTLMMVRFVQGGGWSLYSTANNVMLADVAPVSRRSEVSGYVATMRALALLFGPPLGLWLLGRSEKAAFVGAAIAGGAAFVGTLKWHARHGHSVEHQAEDVTTNGRRPRWLEPTAVPSMTMVATFVASQTIFLVFAPVYVRSQGLDVGSLAIFYPIFGLSLAIAPVLVARLADRIGRRRAITFGCGIAIVGLLVAIMPGEMLTFTIGGLLVGGSSSMVTASVAAATMDRAPRGRLGAAMATYSMGYQLAAGVGGGAWGAVISLVGFPWPFVIAIALQLATLLIAAHSFRDEPEAVRPS